uniref:ORF82b n=1 Tax=Cydia pomonella granulosis virus TaxID=28289 RepID=A0A097P152_GVCP|nr:ORF82b [Cydia pomonella granulovirus]
MSLCQADRYSLSDHIKSTNNKPNPTVIRDAINSTPEHLLYHDAVKLLMFKTLKQLWCSRNVHNYELLERFVSVLNGDLPQFVELYKNATSNTKINISKTNYVVDNINTNNNNILLFEPPFYTPTTPLVFTWLQKERYLHDTDHHPPLTAFINAMGQYCVSTQRERLEQIATLVFHPAVLNGKLTFYRTLRTTLQTHQFLDAPAPRHDICHRFTKLCTLLVQQIRDFTQFH